MILGLDTEYYFGKKALEWAKLMIGNNLSELEDKISGININRLFMCKVELLDYQYNLVLANIETGEVYATFSIVDEERISSNLLAIYATKFKYEERDNKIVRVLIPETYYLIKDGYNPNIRKSFNNLKDIYKEIKISDTPYAYIPTYIKYKK